MGVPTIQQWERAEIERSCIEAQQTRAEDLRLWESNIQRYLNPASTTPYPLEYAFYLLGDVRGGDVLDVGCGSGENAVLLARRRARVVACDISDALVGLARQRLELHGLIDSVRFFVASAHQLPLPDGSVDVVFGIAILHHLDLRIVASETRRVLRNGGRAIFQEPVRNSRVLRAVRSIIPHRAPDVSPYERPLTDAELRRFASGFRSYHARAFMLPHVNLVNMVPALRKALHPSYRLDGTLLRRMPQLKGFAGVRVIEVRK